MLSFCDVFLCLCSLHFLKKPVKSKHCELVGDLPVCLPRNYHVFYYLLAGASEEERKAFHLKKPEEYHYLSQVGHRRGSEAAAPPGRGAAVFFHSVPVSPRTEDM